MNIGSSGVLNAKRGEKVMDPLKKTLHFAAVGLDSPGLVAKITEVILKNGGNIVDVDEDCRRGLFFIFLSIDFSASPQSVTAIAEELKSIEAPTGLKIIVGLGDDTPGDAAAAERQVLTVLGFDRPGIIAKISAFFRDHRINIETCRMIARGKFFAMEMVVDPGTMIHKPSLTPNEAFEKIKGSLQDLCASMGQSVVIQGENTFKKAKKIVVFDVESTLIHEDSVAALVERVKAKAVSINPGAVFYTETRDKMKALMAYAPFLKGLPLSEVKILGRGVRLNEDTVKLIRVLKSMGFKVALLSSGFEFFLKKAFEELQVDYAFCNVLENGCLRTPHGCPGRTGSHPFHQERDSRIHHEHGKNIPGPGGGRGGRFPAVGFHQGRGAFHRLQAGSREYAHRRDLQRRPDRRDALLSGGIQIRNRQVHAKSQREKPGRTTG